MYDKENIFAKIINKQLATSIVYEDDNILAFNDIQPVAPVHIIVIPKKEYTDYSDFIVKASPEEIKNYFTKITEIIKKTGLTDKDYRLVTNKGQGAGQTIFHFHFHIISGRDITGLAG